MRLSMITGLAALVASPALAEPAEAFDVPRNVNGSIIEIGCPVCAAKERAQEAEAAMLPPGTEINEIRIVDGEQMLFTTENWLGGNPRTYVRKATEQQVAKYGPPEGDAAPATAVAEAKSPDDLPESAAPITADVGRIPTLAMTPPSIDEAMKTSALPAAEQFDPSKYKLRVN